LIIQLLIAGGQITPIAIDMPVDQADWRQVMFGQIGKISAKNY
jgi:hypothetical protein